MDIRRCSWFYKSNLDGRWIPFDGETKTSIHSFIHSFITLTNYITDEESFSRTKQGSKELKLIDHFCIRNYVGIG
jgi:hypothetical protein